MDTYASTFAFSQKRKIVCENYFRGKLSPKFRISKKIANLVICGNLASQDLQFSDIEIIIAVRNFVLLHFYCIIAILIYLTLPSLHALGNLCHFYD